MHLSYLISHEAKVCGPLCNALICSRIRASFVHRYVFNSSTPPDFVLFDYNILIRAYFVIYQIIEVKLSEIGQLKILIKRLLDSSLA